MLLGCLLCVLVMTVPSIDAWTAVGNPVVPAGPVTCTPRGRTYTERVATPRKVVALTFDDGPSEFTGRFLDVLEREHVHATFFLIGNQVRSGRTQVRRELADGDTIGNHTYIHPMMTRLTAAQQRGQLVRTTQVIRRISGFTPCLWRPPYGDTNTRLQRLARSLGMLTIDWSVDPQDASDRRAPKAITIYHRVIYGNAHDPDPGVRPGTIVLMHDGGGDRRPTLAALPKIIHTLRARGYTFVTIPELMHIPVRR